MRRVYLILILALWLGHVSAQDKLHLPVWSDFPVLNLDEFLADGISIESITYLPTYIADDEQQVVHYLDYDVMEWKYLDYPEGETQATVREWSGEEIFIYSDDYEYNFDTQEWEIPENDSYDPDAPDEYCGVSSINRDSDIWNYEDGDFTDEYWFYTFCNAVTDEEYVITTIEVDEACEMSDADYFHRYTNDESNLFALFYGLKNDHTTRICLYDVGNREYKQLGDIEKTFDDFSVGYRDENTLIIEGHLDIDYEEYGLPKYFDHDIKDLFQVNLNSNDDVKRISQYADTETVIISKNYLFNDEPVKYVWLWAESISENQEAIYRFTSDTLELELLFTREKEKLDTKLYKITSSPTGDYIYIQEPKIFRSGLESVNLDFYTIDGQFLHTEVFENLYPHEDYTYWLDDTTVVVLPQDYANPYEDYMHPLTVIRIGEENAVNATRRDDYLGIFGAGQTPPFLIDTNYYFAIMYQDSVQLYDIVNDKMIPFTTVRPIGELCFYINGREDTLYVDITQNCRGNVQKIFRAALDVSINPSGEDDGG